MQSTDIFARVENDLRRGDMALARDRLTGHLRAKGYDAEVVTRLGQISFDMHDLFQAGRFWMVSPIEGPQVDQAVAEFARRCGKNPSQIAVQFPNWIRAAKLTDYSSIVQARLRSHGVALEILKTRNTTGGPPSGSHKIKATLITLLIVMALLYAVVSCIVGSELILRGKWDLVFGA